MLTCHVLSMACTWCFHGKEKTDRWLDHESPQNLRIIALKLPPPPHDQQVASRLLSTAPLPGGRRSAAAQTGVSDGAGFAPNHKARAVCHSPRVHSRPATLLRSPFCPFHRSALFLPAAALVKKETSRKRQKGKKHEIRRSQHTNQRGRGFPRCSIGVRSQ